MSTFTNEQQWIFTFGVNHPNAGKYVVIWGTRTSARDEMIRRYSDAWGFQYSNKSLAGVQKYNLTELKE